MKWISDNVAAAAAPAPRAVKLTNIHVERNDCYTYVYLRVVFFP